jgi:hypothetical protein
MKSERIQEQTYLSFRRRSCIDFGNLRHRKGGEWHQWSTSSVVMLNSSSGLRGVLPGVEAEGRPVSIRHLLDFTRTRYAAGRVEAEFILKRFFSRGNVGNFFP